MTGWGFLGASMSVLQLSPRARVRGIIALGTSSLRLRPPRFVLASIMAVPQIVPQTCRYCAPRSDTT